MNGLGCCSYCSITKCEIPLILARKSIRVPQNSLWNRSLHILCNVTIACYVFGGGLPLCERLRSFLTHGTHRHYTTWKLPHPWSGWISAIFFLSFFKDLSIHLMPAVIWVQCSIPLTSVISMAGEVWLTCTRINYSFCDSNGATNKN